VAHQLYLLRHGQTEWSLSGRHTGRTDIPLTPTGEVQARAAGATLRSLREGPALVLSSPRLRATHTAELAEMDVSETTEDLAEWDYGQYEGITTEEIRETVPGWTVWTHPVPGGETSEEVAARADKVLGRVRTALAETDVILIGHGHFSRVLVSRWLGQPPRFGVHYAVDPASITVLGDERGEAQIHQLNIPSN
jgi:broad specificity phosphatase PhoE